MYTLSLTEDELRAVIRSTRTAYVSLHRDMQIHGEEAEEMANKAGTSMLVELAAINSAHEKGQAMLEKRDGIDAAPALSELARNLYGDLPIESQELN